MRRLLASFLLAGPQRPLGSLRGPHARQPRVGPGLRGPFAPRRVATLSLICLATISFAQSPARDQLRLPGPLYPEAVRLYDAGRFEAALADFEEAVPDSNLASAPIEALLLRARLLGAAGRYEESADLWQAIAGREAMLGTLARRATVENLLATGRVEPALAALTTLGAGSQAPAELLLRAAAASRAAGLLDRAAGLYRRAREVAGRSHLADSAGLGLAETLEATGKLRDALDEFSDLQLTFRSVAAYDAATAGARRIAEAIEPPAPSYPLNEDDYETIAERLRGIAAFRRAADVLEEWRQVFRKTGAAERIESDIIENLYSLRANEEARARAEQFLEAHPDSSEAPSVQIVRFRLDVREGKTDDVKSRGLAIWRDPGGRFRPADRRSAARLLAEYLVSVGEAGEALPIYDQLYRQASISGGGGDRLDLLWRTAIAAWRADRRSRTVADLQRLLAMNPDSETLRAATYWLGLAEHAQGSIQSAQNRWTSLVARYPYSYYGVRAAEKLAEVRTAGNAGSTVNGAGGFSWRPRDGVPPDAARSSINAAGPLPRDGAPPDAARSFLSFPDLALSPAARNSTDFRAAEMLSRAGLRSEAAIYARRMAATHRRDAAAALLAARAAESAGDRPSAAALVTAHFGIYLERPARGLPDDLWRLAYPLAYWTEISGAAQRHQVDPLLMLALARQESHFDRAARSPAGAIGLFQIMPATAQRFGALAGPASEDDTPLTQAAESAEIAAKLLRELLTLFDGALAPAVAAYNAGEDRVQVWWNAARGLPEEAFMDSIPYRETRGYVRQVLANYAVYQRLSKGDGDGSLFR